MFTEIYFLGIFSTVKDVGCYGVHNLGTNIVLSLFFNSIIKSLQKITKLIVRSTSNDIQSLHAMPIHAKRAYLCLHVLIRIYPCLYVSNLVYRAYAYFRAMPMHISVSCLCIFPYHAYACPVPCHAVSIPLIVRVVSYRQWRKTRHGTNNGMHGTCIIRYE